MLRLLDCALSPKTTTNPPPKKKGAGDPVTGYKNKPLGHHAKENKLLTNRQELWSHTNEILAWSKTQVFVGLEERRES